MFLKLALLTTLVPALVAAAGVLAASAVAQRRKDAAEWAAPVAVALAYGAGHTALFGLPPWPPVEASQGFPTLALAAAALAVAEGVGRERRGGRWPLRCLLLLVATVFFLRPLLAAWGPVAGGARVAAGVALATGAWAALAGAGRVMATLPLAPLLITSATSLSIAILLAHSASLAQLAGCLAAALGGAAAARLLARGARSVTPATNRDRGGASAAGLARGGVSVAAATAVAAPLFAAFATTAHFYADLALIPVAFLAGAPVAAWLVARQGGEWVAVVAAATMAAAAVTTAALGD